MTEWRDPPVLLQFKEQLAKLRYSPSVVPSQVSAARQFLRHLKDKDISLQEVRPPHVAEFLNEKLEQCRQHLGRPPKNLREWPRRSTAAIHKLLGIVHTKWPPLEPPANERERFQRELCEGYGHWLIQVNGFSKSTLRKNVDAARLFLGWLKDTAKPKALRRLCVSDLDGYLSWRMPELRRATRHGVAICLRSFLRYLFAEGLIARDLSQAVSGPVIYQFEEIPRAFSAEQVETLLRTTRRDRSVVGLRDHAILLLLATYGLRAGEVVRLRVDDINWREERLRVRQSKTGVESHLPLVSLVGEALLKYFQKGRPKTDAREAFLYVRAPYHPFRNGSSLYSVIGRRLKQAGIEVQGRHGAHAFRFARAGSLLRARVTLKSIGDLLGHRSPTSTEVYLRLATDDLRAISLDLPRKESECPLGRTKKKQR